MKLKTLKNRQEKHQHLLENGWWCRFHNECWYESSKDELYVEKGIIVGFRPKSEGVGLEEAFKQCQSNIQNTSTV